MQKRLKFLLPLIIVLAPFTGFGQEKTTRLHGQAKSFKNDVSNILIINLNSKKSTITDALGRFTIEVNLKDTLRFTAVQYKTKEISITDSILLENPLVVNLVDNVINLKEVTVTPYNLTGKIDLDLERLAIKPNVTSSSLGLPNADIEVMTQSERLLLEADRGKYVHYYGIALVINTHKLMNKISGRTKSFEEMVARDENMEFEKEIIAKFPKKTISDNFGIPETNIDGFLTYCMSQKDFSTLSQAANSMELWEYLKARSLEFKKTDVLQE
ncbi:hypothetical protein HZY62_18510 [Maribacter polysiphoniae]|uniref:Carboxypeptidase-like protein n=1 Tax=Maribacter polysiphoniae TaxID=429344 RepID=A0A316DX75_9FLAO|nr:hypothetical protein [Maribacter polysiphoniae]MBD1262596.1 hypothetical protein [Maribacter polysiphoniae]PWK21203.1 hypothetical protein LX92_04004 [Maribacter polysiphoniae]